MKHTPLFMALAIGVTAAGMPAPVDAQLRDRRDVRREIRKEIHRENRKEKRRNAIIGAGIGMLGGAILSDGDPWATVAGAAAGGVIGRAATPDRRDRYRYRVDRDWR